MTELAAMGKRIEFCLSGGLDASQIETIHNTVLVILQETGIGCEHKKTVEAVTSSPGVMYEGGRLKFSPDLVEGSIEKLRREVKHEPHKRLRVTGPWTCFNIIDMQSDEIRASTAKDVVEMLRLVASFDASGPPPVYPCDLDPIIQILWLEKACLEHTAGMGGSMVSLEEETIRWLGELFAAAGRRYWMHFQFIISPLRLDHRALELLWKFKDDPLVETYADICPIPVGGLTAPLTTTGLLAQSAAESIGGWIVTDRLGRSWPGQVLPMRVDIGDMRHATVGYSLPESVMIQVLLRDLTEHFAGYRIDSIYLDTNAKRPDGFCAADRMAYMMMLGLAGYRNFYMGAGQLSMDEIFSPAQFIIDREIGRYVQQILDGIAWQGDVSSIANTVAEGVKEENFMTHPTTLEVMRDFFDSDLFRRSNVGQWRNAGEPTLEESALEKAQQAIASYLFEIDESKKAALDRVFRQACRALDVDLSSQPIDCG